MNNRKDFVIGDGEKKRLKKYKGNDAVVVIPEGVTCVCRNAFKGCTALESVTLPESVTWIDIRAFENCVNLKEVTIDADEILILREAFAGCTSLTVIRCNTVQADKNFAPDSPHLKVYLPNQYYRRKSSIAAEIIPYLAVEDSMDFAGLWIHQSSKTFDAWFAKQSFDACEVLRAMSQMLLEQKNITAKQIARAQEFIQKRSESIPSQVVDEVVATLMAKNSKAAAAIKETEKSTKKKEDLLNSIPLEQYFFNNPHHEFPEQLSSVTKGVKYKDYDCECSVVVIKMLLNEYLAIWDANKREYRGSMSSGYNLGSISHLEKPEVAETIAKELDPVTLSDYLEKLVFGKDYRYFAIPYARFATEQSMDKCIKEISARKKGNAKDKYWAGNLLEAIYYSDTREAFEYIEKQGDPERYASMRGVTVQEWRDLVTVTDMGFDSQGARLFDVGDGMVRLQIQSNFELTLHDANGKTLRSVSKKTPAGITAAEEIAAVKNEVKAFFKKRKEYIREIYITGEQLSEMIWNTTYLKNPLFAPIIESVIWQDESNAFFEVKNGQPLDVNGDAYAPCGKISIAHVLDMTTAEITAWQNNVINSAKTLIVEQVWEPVFTGNAKLIKSNRYANTVWTSSDRNDFKRALKQKGIEVKSEEKDREYDYGTNTYIFDPNGTMRIGRAARLEYVVDENTKNIILGKLSFARGTDREKNAVLYELDKRSLKTFIKQNMATSITTELLDSYTLAQINEFLEFSTNCNSTDCTALLLEYKNNKYDTFDPFELFTLD